MSLLNRYMVFCAMAICLGCSAGYNPEPTAYIQNGEIAETKQGNPQDRSKGILDRKLIYTARVRVETSDFEQFAKALTQQVEVLGGVLTNYQDERTSGDLRSGTWTMRIPTVQFDAAIQWLDKSANVVSKHVKSQDITEEYIDLEARLQNKRNTEQRLKSMLDDRPGRLDEILSVEREMDRVREEIERVEGRIRYLKDQLVLCTIEITANPRLEYVAKDVGLVQRVKESWDGSIQEVQKRTSDLLVEIVSWIPKLPFLLVFLFLCWWVLRFIHRKWSTETTDIGNNPGTPK